MVVGVKYCDGYNARYNRSEHLEDIKKQNDNCKFLLAKEGEYYETLLLMCGCTSGCASYEQYNFDKKITVCEKGPLLILNKPPESGKKKEEK